jgi:hypothetical protein
MEGYNPNNPAYEPQSIPANELILGALSTIFRAGGIPRDF